MESERWRDGGWRDFFFIYFIYFLIYCSSKNSRLFSRFCYLTVMESLTLDSENVAPPPKKAGKAAKGGKKTIEEMYQKKTQLEHIL